MRTRRGRLVAIVAAAGAGALATLAAGAPALAHAEVEVEPAQAGARDALVTVLPEAHHHNAGAVSVQVFPPEGIAAGEVALVSGPEDWELTTDEDSYTVAGPELAIETSPEHEIRVRQLPNQPVVHFRILTTYSDGEVDRWIEIPTEDDPEPPDAAPTVELAAAAAPTTPAAAPATTPAEPTTSPAAAAEDGSSGSAWPLLVIAAIVAVAMLGGGIYVARRRGVAAGG